MRKKVVFAFVFALGLVCSANAQMKGNAIGLRFGGGSSGNYGTEISFQHAMGSANRLEVDLGVNNWGTGLTGIYQWAWKIQDGFNWYAGVGGNLGIWNSSKGDGVNLGVAGQVGVEYNFDFPLQLSLDYRPIIPIVNGNGYSDGIALGVRYKF